MKIQQLFDELKTITENKEYVFEESGVVNCYEKMKYGFFPLGLGVLNKTITIKSDPKEIEIYKEGIMVLGNDFGTVGYVKSVKNYSEGFGETESQTITNMYKFLPDVFTNKTFFTNFYLGVRLDDGPYCGTTMTKRIYNGKVNKLRNCYKNLCNEFFKVQLELIKPRIVICLGHEVKNALIDSGIPFHQWKPKTGSLEKIYLKNGTEYIIGLNGIKFIIIPHPSYPVNLLKPPYLQKLKAFLESN